MKRLIHKIRRGYMKNIVWNIVFIILCIPTLIWCKIQSVKNIVNGDKGRK